MEAIFKKQFWLINLAFLGSSAFLLARGSNQFVALYVAQRGASGSAPAVAAVSRPPPSRDKTVRDLPDNGNIFGARVEDLEAAAAALAAAAAAAVPKPTPPADAEAVPTALRAKLTGVSYFLDGELSLASIMDLSTQDVELYSINPCGPARKLPDDEDEFIRAPPCNKLLTEGTILEIQPERVILFHKTNNRREYLDMHEEPGKAPAPPPVAAATTAPEATADAASANLGKGITKVAENQYRVPQSDVDEVMANLNNVAMEARIVPSFEGGRSNGFKLFSIKPGSIYSKIGIQNGDVINRINGYDISTPDKALEVYGKLKDAREISVELTRRGQKSSMSYTIQ